MVKPGEQPNTFAESALPGWSRSDNPVLLLALRQRFRRADYGVLALAPLLYALALTAVLVWACSGRGPRHLPLHVILHGVTLASALLFCNRMALFVRDPLPGSERDGLLAQVFVTGLQPRVWADGLARVFVHDIAVVIAIHVPLVVATWLLAGGPLLPSLLGLGMVAIAATTLFLLRCALWRAQYPAGLLGMLYAGTWVFSVLVLPGSDSGEVVRCQGSVMGLLALCPLLPLASVLDVCRHVPELGALRGVWFSYGVSQMLVTSFLILNATLWVLLGGFILFGTRRSILTRTAADAEAAYPGQRCARKALKKERKHGKRMRVLSLGSRSHLFACRLFQENTDGVLSRREDSLCLAWQTLALVWFLALLLSAFSPPVSPVSEWTKPLNNALLLLVLGMAVIPGVGACFQTERDVATGKGPVARAEALRWTAVYTVFRMLIVVIAAGIAAYRLGDLPANRAETLFAVFTAVVALTSIWSIACGVLFSVWFEDAALAGTALVFCVLAWAVVPVLAAVGGFYFLPVGARWLRLADISPAHFALRFISDTGYMLEKYRLGKGITAVVPSSPGMFFAAALLMIAILATMCAVQVRRLRKRGGQF